MARPPSDETFCFIDRCKLGLGAARPHGFFPKNKYEYAHHQKKDKRSRIHPNRKSVSYSTHEAEKPEAE